MAFERLLEAVAAPGDVETIEAENWAWIDFFWSMFGRSAGVGEAYYDRIRSPEQFERLVRDFSRRLAAGFGMRGPGDLIEARILEGAIRMLAGGVKGLEKTTGDYPFSEATRRGLVDYLAGPVMNQLAAELGAPGPGAGNLVETLRPIVEARDGPWRELAADAAAEAAAWLRRPEPPFGEASS